MKRGRFKTDKRKSQFVLGFLLLTAGVAQAVEAEDQIRFKDGGTLSATILQRDGENLVLGVERGLIDTVNGKPLPPPVIAGNAAPDFKAEDLSGVGHTFSENKGYVTLLKFWASWCPHCRSDIPLIKKLYTQHNGQGLRILTVSVDQDLPTLQAFLKKEAIPYPVISALRHPELTDLYEMQGIPAYFLIDGAGTIAGVWKGSVTERESDFEKTLERLLASGTTLSKAAD